LIQTIINTIEKEYRIIISRYERVHGGDINECYCLYGKDKKYFLKINSAANFPGMFELEADGLNALRNKSELIVPDIIKQGSANNQQWLLLQWMEKEAPGTNTMENFGTALANVHLQPQQYFGWHNVNYIGSLPQLNTQQDNWVEFYTQYRIMPLVKMLFDKKDFSKVDIDFAAAFCRKAAVLFPPEPPALLHGDLWSGNYMIVTGGKACIFDPAVYCGHREMDLGMTKLFGGFSQPFYDAYNETYPLEKGWQQRLFLTQLYPLLVHAVLFGGHYITSTRDILKKIT
jgi:fructosamine-3-kinase